MPKPENKATFVCEAEVTDGLEFVSEAELRKLGAEIIGKRAGEIDFRFSGNLQALLKLKTVQSVSVVQAFAVPRPRGLLDNTHIRHILEQIEAVRKLSPSDSFQTFFLAAAGSDSSIMQRLKAVICEAAGLTMGDEKGDLWIRVRPSRVGESSAPGWQVLIRLTPRPLVTRSWRVSSMEGALNAATAHAMIWLTEPHDDDVFVNLGCGSGTLLIERIAHSRCQSISGMDNNLNNLRCAQANLEASQHHKAVPLYAADLLRLPLRSASVSALVADLPFGQLVGTHQENQCLYPAMLEEAARVAQTGAKFVLITHEIRLMESLLSQQEQWSLGQTIRVNLRGLHPRIYVLRRR
ncbi:MAG: methyltransferase [Chloroflexota bacterium]